MAKIKITMLASGGISVENLEGDVDIEWVDERMDNPVPRRSAMVDIPSEDELLDLVPVQFSHPFGELVDLRTALENWGRGWSRMYDYYYTGEYEKDNQ
jgi:hypothetical protein